MSWCFCTCKCLKKKMYEVTTLYLKFTISECAAFTFELQPPTKNRHEKLLFSISLNFLRLLCLSHPSNWGALIRAAAESFIQELRKKNLRRQDSEPQAAVLLRDVWMVWKDPIRDWELLGNLRLVLLSKGGVFAGKVEVDGGGKGREVCCIWRGNLNPRSLERLIDREELLYCSNSTFLLVFHTVGRLCSALSVRSC